MTCGYNLCTKQRGKEVLEGLFLVEKYDKKILQQLSKIL